MFLNANVYVARLVGYTTHTGTWSFLLCQDEKLKIWYAKFWQTRCFCFQKFIFSEFFSFCSIVWCMVKIYFVVNCNKSWLDQKKVSLFYFFSKWWPWMLQMLPLGIKFLRAAKCKRNSQREYEAKFWIFFLFRHVFSFFLNIYIFFLLLFDASSDDAVVKTAVFKFDVS